MAEANMRIAFLENVVRMQLDDLQGDITRNTTLMSHFKCELLGSGFIDIQAKISAPYGPARPLYYFEKTFTVDPLCPESWRDNVRLDLIQLYLFCLRFFHKPGMSPYYLKVAK